VWGEFRRARAFRRSEAEAVSSVQKMFEQSCIIPQNRNFLVKNILFFFVCNSGDFSITKNIVDDMVG